MKIQTCLALATLATCAAAIALPQEESFDSVRITAATDGTDWLRPGGKKQKRDDPGGRPPDKGSEWSRVKRDDPEDGPENGNEWGKVKREKRDDPDSVRITSGDGVNADGGGSFPTDW
jgi:hypothetical protein